MTGVQTCALPICNKEEKISKNSKVLQPITERKEMTIIQRYADFIKDQLKNEQNSSIARSNLNYDSINESVKVTKDRHHYKITKNGEHCCTIHMPPREKGYSIPTKERMIRRSAKNKLNTKEIDHAITQISKLNEQTESMVNESEHPELGEVVRLARDQTGQHGSVFHHAINYVLKKKGLHDKYKAEGSVGQSQHGYSIRHVESGKIVHGDEH